MKVPRSLRGKLPSYLTLTSAGSFRHIQFFWTDVETEQMAGKARLLYKGCNSVRFIREIRSHTLGDQGTGKWRVVLLFQRCCGWRAVPRTRKEINEIVHMLNLFALLILLWNRRDLSLGTCQFFTWSHALSCKRVNAMHQHQNIPKQYKNGSCHYCTIQYTVDLNLYSQV